MRATREPYWTVGGRSARQMKASKRVTHLDAVNGLMEGIFLEKQPLLPTGDLWAEVAGALAGNTF